MAFLPKLPLPVAHFFTLFPLHTYPAIAPLNKAHVSHPTLWVHPPAASPPLSGDVECLKWQAYLALRGLKGVKVRWDISQEGAIDGRLPNLHVSWSERLQTEKTSDPGDESDGQLLTPRMIPSWVEAHFGIDSTRYPLEGYNDERARDESRAWVALLEGPIHAALIALNPKPWSLAEFLLHAADLALKPDVDPLQTVISPSPPPLTGFAWILPSFGTRISKANVVQQYKDAVAALSERLGTEKWFLNSVDPTPLDALAFAYIHCLLHSGNETRLEVMRRVNLVAWERRVRELVSTAFV